jgi:hypothetical protein
VKEEINEEKLSEKKLKKQKVQKKTKIERNKQRIFHWSSKHMSGECFLRKFDLIGHVYVKYL